jgi:hypothetical protein
MVKPRDPSSLPDGWTYGPLGGGLSQPSSPGAPRTPQGLLSYIEALHRQANDNPPPSAPRHAPMLAQAPTSLDEAHRAENRWPVLGAMDERARRQSVLENSPALFAIEDNPAASGDAPVHRIHSLGAGLVQKHDQEIEEEAARVGVDPDLLRAIMYVEVSQGYYGYPAEQKEWIKANLPMPERLRSSLDRLPWSDSILPMNVRRSLWAGLLNDGRSYSRRYIEAGHAKGQVVDQSHDVLDNPRLNIRAGAILLKRIQDRLENPSIRKVATLYNGLGQSAVANYGAQVERVYRAREWEQAGTSSPGSLIGRGPRPR